MSKVNEQEAYQAFLDEVKAKLPSELQSHLDAIAGTDAGKEIFRGKLREDHFYTKLNEVNEVKKRAETDWQSVRAKAAAQDEWYKKNAPLAERSIKEAQALKTRLRSLEDKASEAGLSLDDLGDATTERRSSASAAVPEGISAEELNDLRAKVNFFDKALPKVLGDLTAIVRESIKENLDVSPEEVISYASEHGVDPRSAFLELTREEREKRDSKALDDALEQAREEGRRDAISKLQGPDRIRHSGPSVVDQLTAKDAPVSDARSRVDQAVRDFMELGAS